MQYTDNRLQNALQLKCVRVCAPSDWTCCVQAQLIVCQSAAECIWINWDNISSFVANACLNQIATIQKQGCRPAAFSGLTRSAKHLACDSNGSGPTLPQLNHVCVFSSNAVLANAFETHIHFIAFRSSVLFFFFFFYRCGVSRLARPDQARPSQFIIQ